MVKSNSLNYRFRNPLAASVICKSSSKISIIIYVVLASIIVDTFINQNIQVRNSVNITSSWGIALFISLAAIAIVGQYYILGFVKHQKKGKDTQYFLSDYRDHPISVNSHSLVCRRRHSHILALSERESGFSYCG
jgi:hypothetical protein